MFGIRIGAVAGLAAVWALSFAPPSAGRSDLEAAAAVAGKFETADGGSLVLAVDENGLVSGFFERRGVFGQIMGRAVGDRIEGVWFSESGAARCETPRMGAATWGDYAFRASAPDRLEGLFGRCGETPTESWTARATGSSD